MPRNKLRRSPRVRNRHQKITPRFLNAPNDSDSVSCKFQYRGCKRRLPPVEMAVHVKECRFRWYKCEGRLFAGWSCPWRGYYEDIARHFQQVHPERAYMRSQNFIETTVVFDSDSYDLELIRRRKRLFWFKHRLMHEQGAAYWLCQYVGPSDEAATYYYEFVMREGARKFALTELCHGDAEDANEIYESGKCVIMTFDQIKSFISESGEIHVNFKIVKKVKKRR